MPVIWLATVRVESAARVPPEVPSWMVRAASSVSAEVARRVPPSRFSALLVAPRLESAEIETVPLVMVVPPPRVKVPASRRTSWLVEKDGAKVRLPAPTLMRRQGLLT